MKAFNILAASTVAFGFALGAGAADAKSFKRGVSENEFQLRAQIQPISPGVSWYYNWGNAAGKGYNNEIINFEDMEYIPMCWGNYSADAIREYCKAHPNTKYLLGFNEPNFKAQANMTPAEAAERWPEVQALAKELGLQLVAPALNYSPDAPYQNPLTWMDEFVKLVGTDAFDYTAIHNYGGLGVMKTLAGQFHDKYGKPVWVTEFCYWPGGAGNVYVAPSTQIASMIETVEWLETTPWIYRYAWFKCVGHHDSSNRPNYGLEISATGQNMRELSPQGWVYTYMSTFDMDKYYVPEELVAASDYIASKGLSLAKGENASCPSPIEISQFSSGAYCDYLFEVPTAGTYYMYLTVSGQGEPVRFDPKLGFYAVSEDGEKGAALCEPKQFAISGDDKQYTKVMFELSLPAGKQRIRMEDVNPYAPSGIHIASLMLSESAGIDGVSVDTDNSADAIINVYNLSGAVVRANVVRANATEGLAPGFYIVGGEKVLVR